MHGDFSRRTFDAADRYRAVLLQQGRVLLDADVNEQADITAHHDEARTRDVVGRSGGPAPEGDEVGPFAIVVPGASRADRWRFTDQPWSALRITAGTYYVDGVLIEGDDAPDDGWPLGDQPYLPTIPGKVGGPGLPEPTEDGRYAALLDVWERQVTFDEDPELLEPALGGPDTTTRAQTVWQVRLEPIGEADRCSDLHGRAAAPRRPRLLEARLAEPPESADPCEISASGGYQRLENQLYRVQVFDGPDPGNVRAPGGTFVFSRDNGSVVAGIDELTPVDTAAGTAVLTLDRLGRDDELSFREGQLVEVTSTDWELRGRHGFLATAGAPTGLTLPITWHGTPPVAPASLDALGRAPVVRRWEGGPLPISPAPTDLEGGIQVSFPQAGTARTGDYWLIPARTVREVYGLTQLSGTIEWPTDPSDPTRPLPQPPVGPQHHLSPLAVLSRTGEGWSLESDCRLLFPSLTGLVAIDEVGGDGQEAMPGDALPEPLRVVVRQGDRPVVGAPVLFTADSGGHLATGAEPTTDDPSTLIVPTDDDGVAHVRWLLPRLVAERPAPTTQRLTARRLDDHGRGTGALVAFTGRLSVADQMAWRPPACKRFAETRTVQEALRAIVDHAELRLLGGDGQSVRRAGEVVGRPVRVVVEDGCGPVGGAVVTAVAGDEVTGFGFVARAEPGAPGGPVEPTPTTLRGATRRVDVLTDDDGVAAFWWQPSFGNLTWSTLDIRLAEAPPVIRVVANLDAGSARTEGIHLREVTFGDDDETPFENDSDISVDQLVSKVRLVLDQDPDPVSVIRKPVVRVELELPWPTPGLQNDWGTTVIGTQTVTLDAALGVTGPVITWVPATTSPGRAPALPYGR